MDLSTLKAMQEHVQRGRRIYDVLDQALEDLRAYNTQGIDLAAGQIGPPDLSGATRGRTLRECRDAREVQRETR